jgi:hypothetical protein
MEKIEKEYPDFCKEVQNLPEEALKARIVQLQSELAQSEEHMENNEDLQHARQTVTGLAGPYRDVKKAVKAKTKYLLNLLGK